MEAVLCDRCDKRVSVQPRDVVELSRTILEDKGVDRGFAQVEVSISIKTFDGRNWNAVDLCPDCFDAVLDAAFLERDRKD